ncbi:sugar dehydrogenase complex small subunit [Poseidonocella sedimentorum]|uniref:Membrane bound FAD containing D-sorbitol dehydrogenase n=1 Tax=Poseidonocella sedimentorum TaxID=871652 RepID=A0A1I6CUV6_9RHOB|nr:sugar dehydrogenase complex small subunit [Poseidonocella sedimentorum]SFQ97015.1 Membrane bound FAD containing D-sorbitol dehydrogenase [Poseidonocella sedimentorum]
MSKARLSRRLFLTGASTAALLPGLPAAQIAAPPLTEFAAACRALSGFDGLPRVLLEGAATALDDGAKAAFAGGTAPEDLQQTLLKTLYTGMHSPEDGAPTRFVYSEALMYAAVEDSLNVPSYCGGVPGYWAAKPAGA